MLRKRLVGACLVVSTALGGVVAVPRAARAQEVIDLDDDAPKASAKKGPQRIAPRAS